MLQLDHGNRRSQYWASRWLWRHHGSWEGARAAGATSWRRSFQPFSFFVLASSAPHLVPRPVIKFCKSLQQQWRACQCRQLWWLPCCCWELARRLQRFGVSVDDLIGLLGRCASAEGATTVFVWVPERAPWLCFLPYVSCDHFECRKRGQTVHPCSLIASAASAATPPR